MPSRDDFVTLNFRGVLIFGFGFRIVARNPLFILGYDSESDLLRVNFSNEVNYPAPLLRCQHSWNSFGRHLRKVQVIVKDGNNRLLIPS